MIEFIEQLDDRLLEIIGEMIHRDGVDGSGAYNYYAGRVLQNISVFNAYDSVIPPHVIQERPSLVTYVGSGFGFMAFILAMSGIRVHCFEGNVKRFEGLMHIRKSLAQDIDDVESLVTASDSTFPPHKLILPEGRNLLLFGNFAAPTSDEARDSIISSFAHFDWVIMSERLFCRSNQSEIEQRALSELIASKYESTRTSLGNSFAKYRKVQIDDSAKLA